MSNDQGVLTANSDGPVSSTTSTSDPSIVAADAPRSRDKRDSLGASSPSNDRIPAPLRQHDLARYRVLAEHGRGGLGRVNLAHHNELGRDVAWKELLQPSYRSELRFFREALVTASLERPSMNGGAFPSKFDGRCERSRVGWPKQSAVIDNLVSA